MSALINFLVLGDRQPTKVPDPLSGASRVLHVFNLADWRIRSEQPSGGPKVVLEYHSATSARIARFPNSLAFARPIHSSGHKSKKLNVLNTSEEIFSTEIFAEEFGLMHPAIVFGEIDSSGAVCSLINAKLASNRDTSEAGYEGNP